MGIYIAQCDIMDMIIEILSKNGPSLSSDIVQELVEKHRLSSVAARKQVSRARGDVHKLEGLPLPRNVKFVYLKKDYRSPFYWKALYKAFKETNSAYWHAIAAVKERNGIMPFKHFLIACGSPLRQQKHIPPEKILQRLEIHDILKTVEISGIGKCIALAEKVQDVPILEPELRARLVAEKILISAVTQWAKNLGLVSFNLIKNRDEEELPTVSTTVWDVAGPSYISALINVSKTDKSKIKQGFLACDILLNKSVSEDGIKPFIRKCNTLRGLSNVGRCIQMFIANDYHQVAFQQAKNEGILPATVETLFGKDVAQGLVSLLRTLEGVAQSVSIDPERFNTLFDQLGKIEGAVGNLRGVLFEYFSANVVEKAFRTDSIKLNQICKTSDGKSAESDIIAVLNDGKVFFVECKGHQPNGTVSDEEIQKWLNTRIPTLRAYALRHPDWKDKRLSFAIWTTGKFSDHSLALLALAESKTIKYEISHLDAEGLLPVIKSCNDMGLLKTYFKCFLDYPLKKLERQWIES